MENLKVSLSHLPGLFFWILVAAFAAVLFISYRRFARGQTGNFGYLLLGLKLIALGFLVLLFIEPVVSWQHKGKEKPGICVLVDGSRSMGLKSGSGNFTRAQKALDIINSKEFRGLEDKFRVRYFQFSQGMMELGQRDIGIIKSPEGRYTDLGQAMGFVAEKLRKDGVSACVVISDGANNFGADPVQASAGLGIPVYSVALSGAGARTSMKKASILNGRYNRRVMVDNLAQAEFTVRSEGFQNQKASIELRDSDKVIQRKQVVLDVSRPLQNLALQWIPREVGSRSYKLVLLPGEGVQPVEYGFSPVVESPHLSLLYIEGTPRWEFKFLKRALEADQNIDLTCFLRMGKTKFLQVDSAADARKRSFPNSLEELAKYQIVIIGDVNRDFLGDDFLLNLTRCVSEAGTGLLFLGTRVFGSGSYDRTPVAQALPIVAGTPESSWISGDFYIDLTQEGSLHPVFNYFEDPLTNRKFWSALPPMAGCIPTRAVKAGAEVLAVNPNIQTGGAKTAVLAVQNYGKGKTAVWGVDTTWKWKVNPSQFKGQEDAYQKFWGQLFRWLVRRDTGGGVKPEIQISLDKDSFDQGEPVRVVIQAPKATTAPGQEGPQAQVQAALVTPDGEEVNLSLTLVGMAEQEWYSDYFPASQGRFRITAKGKLGDIILEQKDSYFTVTAEDIETGREGTDEALLAGVSSASGGKYFTEQSIEALPAQVNFGASVASKIEVEKKLHDLVYLIGFVSALTAEWVLRKRRDLF